MTGARLPTHVWVMAQIRRCSAAGIPATVVHRGEKMGGSVMLKLYRAGEGCRLLALTRDLDGNLAWYPAHSQEVVDERTADAQIDRTVARDPDLWVVEVETRDGSHPFEDLP